VQIKTLSKISIDRHILGSGNTSKYISRTLVANPPYLIRNDRITVPSYQWVHGPCNFKLHDCH